MNAFAFGKLVGEKVAAGPLNAEAPMTNPAQAAATNEFLNQPGRRFLTDMAHDGRKLQRGANLAAAASPAVGSLVGRVVGGRLGGTVGNLGGAAFGQQLRHYGGDVAAAFGAQPADKPIPYGMRNWRLTNQPSAHAAELTEERLNTARMLDSIGQPTGKR